MDRARYARQLCPVITSLNHFKGLYGHFEHCSMLTNFLVYGDMPLVNEVIFEFNDVDFDHFISRVHISKALILSLNENQHDRVIELLVVVQERDEEKDDGYKLAGRETTLVTIMYLF